MIPSETPIALTGEFAADENKIRQWNGFLRKGGLPAMELPLVLEEISKFLLPVLQKEVSGLVWLPSGRWTSDS